MKNISKLFLFTAILILPIAVIAQTSPTSTTAVARPMTANENDASRLEQAIGNFFGGISNRDTTARKADELYRAGTALERGGRRQEAMIQYDLAMKMNPEDPRVHIAMGRLLELSQPALSLYHYQSAFRYSISAAVNEAPAVEILRRFLVGRYLQYALPITDADVSTKLLELAVSLAPEDPRIHAHLAMAYFFGKKYERSVQESRNALALGLEDGLIHTNIAAAYAQMRDKERAEAALKVALELDEVDINEALNAIRRSNESETLVTFNDVIGRDRLNEILTMSTKGRLEAAIIAWQKGDRATGLRLAEEAAAGNPMHSYSLIVVGDFKRSMGDTAGAMACYQEAVIRNPYNQLGFPRMGDLAYADANYGLAAENYMRAMDLMSGRIDKIDILDRTAVALASQKKHDQAIMLLDRWLRANQNAPEAFELSVRKAGIMEDAQRGPQAEQILRGLIDRDKLNPAGYIVLHGFYTGRNDTRKANQIVNDGIVRLQAARDKDPLNPDFYRDLARLYRLIGKEQEARQALLQGGLRTLEKRFFANALFVADAETEAYDVLKAWLAVEPRNPEAVLSFGWVAARLNRDLDQALERVEVLARESGPDNVPIRRTRSYLYNAMGKHEKAIEEIKGFLTDDNLPEADFFHRLWGQSAEALNRRSEAIIHYRKALELDPDAHEDLGARIARLEASGN